SLAFGSGRRLDRLHLRSLVAGVGRRSTAFERASELQMAGATCLYNCLDWTGCVLQLRALCPLSSPARRASQGDTGISLLAAHRLLYPLQRLDRLFTGPWRGAGSSLCRRHGAALSGHGLRLAPRSCRDLPAQRTLGGKRRYSTGVVTGNLWNG